jgi:hypothetical protein
VSLEQQPTEVLFGHAAIVPERRGDGQAG